MDRSAHDMCGILRHMCGIVRHSPTAADRTGGRADTQRPALQAIPERKPSGRYRFGPVFAVLRLPRDCPGIGETR